jgi:hypothetical protein
MKKLLFAALLLGFAFTTKAQSITNNTFCDVQVTQYCINAACMVVSTNVITVTAGSSVPIISCPAGTRTIWGVCYAPVRCGITPNCVKVDGNAVLIPCGPGTYTGNIFDCDFCYSSGGGANVIFDPTTGNLDINP